MNALEKEPRTHSTPVDAPSARTVALAALAAALLPVSALPPAAAEAQQGASMEYTEVTRVEAPGTMGALLARAGAGEEARAVYLLDTTLRTDAGSTSTIFDAASREWTFLDHEERTWFSYSFAELMELTEEMRQAIREGQAEMEAELEENRAEMEAAMAEAEASMTVSVEHVATGERGPVGGWDAARHQIIVTVEEAEGVEGAEEVEGGSLVILLDLWISEELARADPLHWDGTPGSNPFWDAMMEDPAFRELAEEMGAAFGGEGEPDYTAFAMVDPRVGAAMGQAMETLAEMEGIPVSTRTIVAVLPPAVELDTELLLAWEPESMGSQIRGEASAAARDQAAEAARGAVRGLTRGILGRRGEDPEPEVPEEDLIIRPLFRLTSDVTDVRVGGPPSPDLFVVPEGYRELRPDADTDPTG
jgi:hypothetical protein